MRVAFKKYECYGQKEGYTLPLTLINAITGKKMDVKGSLDTGFDGSIMLDSDTYANLGMELSERPESQFPAYRTLSGAALFRSSFGRAVIAGRETPVEMITPVQGKGKILLGRRILWEFTTLLHRAERVCMGEALVEG